ncbi:MAG: hypothetical protein HYX76_09270 [Acidobacteria bacterium]|nr:hypothetical protein [Acidobacteriota bacterium]
MRDTCFVVCASIVLAAASMEARAPRGTARAASAAAPGAPQTQPVQVRTSFSRTALWVGDHVTYTIELSSAPDVGILTDDLDKAKLRLRGLEIVSADTEEATRGNDASIHRFRYELATYEPPPATLRIDELLVRFYVKRPGQRIEDVVPAGEVRIPPSSIALRSTLPDNMRTATIRDLRAHVSLPVWWAWIRPIGIALILVSIVPVVLWAVAALHRVRPLKPKRRAWQALRLTRKSLAELRSADMTDEAARREGYVRLDWLLRDHLGRKLAVTAQALTPAELAATVRKNGAKLPADSISSLLQECELARYCPPGRLPASDQFLKALEQAEAIVARR